MKRILIPTDFSKESENAIQTAIPIAQAFKATVVLLHVLEISSKEAINTTADTEIANGMFIHEGLKLAKANLDRSITLHSLDSVDFKVERYIRIGSSIKEIIGSISRMDIDFVIMGTKGAWGLNDILLGTNTDKVMRMVKVPVLSVNQVVEPSSFKRIVFPTTTLNKENNLIDVIKQLQSAFGSIIHLVRINTPSHFQADSVTRTELEKYADDHDFKNFEVHVYSHENEEDGIRDFANRVDGGIIAMSTSAHRGLRRLIEGSIAKEMRSHSSRPVLTMKMG